MRTAAPFALVLVAACATTAPEMAAPPAPTRLEATPRPPPSFDAKAFAQGQLTPAECEAAARRLKDISPDQAWDALKACVERSRWPRGEFTNLDRLTAGAWDQDLQTRPDAARLIARVIAIRGGDVEGDLPTAQKSRLPVFTLAAALRQPDVYKGRYVLLRGSPNDIKADGSGKASTLSLRETSLRATSREVDVGPRYRSGGSSSYSRDIEIRTSRYGNASVSDSGRASSKWESGLVGHKFENEHVETGREALGRLPQADPFLVPDKDFIFLARFDGTRASAKDDNKAIAVLTIVGYYAPNALVIE